MPIIEVNNVTKRFPARRGVQSLLGRGGLQELVSGSTADDFAALRNISFAIEPGESVGIIGRNGSGKSTLLKLIAGVTAPTEGDITVNGRVASLLELGAGFHPMLTGRENIYLNAGMLGLRRRDVNKVFDGIVDFSGIGPFLDNPVETYSSGMYVRLGFAVAVHSDPAIFLVDEVLAVGDEEFQRKCRGRINSLKEEGKTILFVSHDLGLVSALCDRVLLLQQGELVSRGSARETVDFYLRQVGSEQGTHILHDGDTEAIFNGGRISLFYKQREITPATGFEVQLVRLGTYHNCIHGEWRVEESTETSCKAVGRLFRLPVSLHYDVSLRGDCLRWEISVDCERETEIDQLEANCFLHTLYERWLYGDLEGVFPEILPTDTEFAPVVVSEMGVDDAAVFAGEGPLPPIQVRATDAGYHTKLMWANTEFIMGSRVLHASARIPDSAQPFAPGRHRFVTLELDFSKSEESIRSEVLQNRTVRAGELGARFYQGCVQLSYQGMPLTRLLHCWTSLFIDRLWHNSQGLRWDSVRRDGEALEAEGASRRLPFRQYWRIWPEEDGLGVAIDLECGEPLSLQEYHFSLMVDGSYTAWESDAEIGQFPEFSTENDDWVHLNESYSAERFGRLVHSTSPTVELSAGEDSAGFRFTALNTGRSQHARVMQALRVPESGLIVLEPGRHRLFTGRIAVHPV